MRRNFNCITLIDNQWPDRYLFYINSCKYKMFYWSSKDYGIIINKTKIRTNALIFAILEARLLYHTFQEF